MVHIGYVVTLKGEELFQKIMTGSGQILDLITKKFLSTLKTDLLVVDMAIQRMSIPTLVGVLSVRIIIGRRRTP
tara:strand:- start:344 stop:565 length:222 start_codon:yes stop_codon:yes gene_type:complete